MTEDIVIEAKGGSEINWVIYEYIGCEVCKSWDLATRLPVRLSQFEDIQVGDLLVLWSGYENECVGEVVRMGDNLYADTGGMFHSLEFDGDNRHCWVSSTACGKRLFNAVTEGV